MISYELRPKFDSAQSFNGKAVVRHELRDDLAETIELISYETLVCRIVKPAGQRGYSSAKVRIFGTYNKKGPGDARVWSATTLRHIKEFLLQHGLRADDWQQMQADYCKAEEA